MHAGFRVVGSRGAHALLDLASHGQESLLNVAGVLGGGLEEGDAQAVSEFLDRAVSFRLSRGTCLGLRSGSLESARGPPLQVTCGGSRLQLKTLTYLGNGVLDNLLIRHIALVAYEQLVDALSGVPVNLLEPLLDVVERVHVGDIVDNADAVSTAVVR